MKEVSRFMANFCIVLSAVAVVLAGIGAFGTDLWLASTQWILVSIVLASYAIYFK